MTSPIEVSAEPNISEPRNSENPAFKSHPSVDKPNFSTRIHKSKRSPRKPPAPRTPSDCSPKATTESEVRLCKKHSKDTVSGNSSGKVASSNTPDVDTKSAKVSNKKSKDASAETDDALECSKRNSTNSTTSTATASKALSEAKLDGAIKTTENPPAVAATTCDRAKPPSSQTPVTSTKDPVVTIPPIPIADDDVVFVDGQAFNGRGYPVCGVANQRGKRCGRIGTCPFHSGVKTKARGANSSQPSVSPSKPPAKRPRSVQTPTPSSLLAESASNLDTNEGSQPVSAVGDDNDCPTTPIANGKRARTAQAVKREVAIPPRKARFKRSWTPDEHRLFLTAMRRHGRGKWKEIAADVQTRTANQCQSHAQKYFLRQAKSDSERKKKSIHDVTDVDVALDDAVSPSAVVIQQPTSSALVLASSTKPVAILPRTSQAVPLAPGPAPPSNSIVIGRDGTTLMHRVNPISVSASALLTCTGRGSTVPTVTSQTLSTVPVVFPVSNYGSVQYAPLMQPVLNSGNASSAAVIPPPPLAKLRVTVHVNGRLKGGMALVLPDTLDQFFEHAKSKLNFGDSFCRVFTRSGGEITCLDEMCPDDMLWLSTGEDFTTPR